MPKRTRPPLDVFMTQDGNFAVLASTNTAVRASLFVPIAAVRELTKQLAALLTNDERPTSNRAKRPSTQV